MLLRPILRPFVRWWLFYFYDTCFIVGDKKRLSIGKKVATSNAIFNLSSGKIFIDDYTIFGQNVMILTGRHKFKDGERAGLESVKKTSSWGGGELEVPNAGYDIHIGKGCWIASGVIVSGGVKIGNNVIVGAGTVVTKDIPDYSIVTGLPGKVIGDTRDL